ncbi:MAG TPA: flagellar motor protein MotA [Rhodospirillaceae bacterium]|nr:flagellar motor protein MotA [Rhodospirillaceae bacterium]
MNQVRRFLFRMAIFLGAVLLVIVSLYSGLAHAFTNNVGLNSLILAILLLGIALNFREVVMLGRDARWLDDYRHGREQAITSQAGPRLLASLATMLGDRRDRLALSPAALRSLLDGLASRMDESREIARYFTGLMIFLGLLGTFWGLSQTIGSIGDVIRTLTLSSEDVQAAFASLKQGLDAPLAGMGTAFSTSLIGLSGSLILGFLDLQAGQAQNAFYNDLEEWLSGQTRLSAGIGSGEASDQSVPAYIQALLEQTAESLDNLQRVIARGEESRIAANTNMRQLTERLATMADQMKIEQNLMLKLAEHQLEMKPILAKLADHAGTPSIDDGTRHHIRNIDLTLNRLLEESGPSRDEMVRNIRSEFKLLARTIAALAEEEASSAPPNSLGRLD